MSEEILCNTCRMIFKDNEEHRIHFKSPLHTFNLKRKVADLAPINQEQYDKKMQQISSKEENKKYEGKCKSCKKNFSTKNAYDQHLLSKKHLTNEKELNLKKKRQEKKLESTNNKEETKNETNENEKSEKEEEGVENSEKESVSESTEQKEKLKTVFPEIYTKLLDLEDLIQMNYQTENGEELNEEEKKEVEEKIKNSYAFGMEECLFCFKISTSFSSNVKHMTKDHGMFIPDLEYLVDLEGMIYYLGKKLSIGNGCFWCEKHFHSLESAQHHMRDKSHCKLRDFDEDDEFDEFYDFTDSYKNGEDIDDVISSTKKNISVSNDGLYITFKNSNKVVSHRSLTKYHKQKLSAPESRESVLINKMLFNYKMLGWKTATTEQKKIHQQKKHYLNLRQKWYMNLGIKCNRLQKYFKDQNLLIKY